MPDPVRLTHDTLDTPIGRLLIVYAGAAAGDEVVYVDFDEDHDRCRRHMTRRYGACAIDRRSAPHPAHTALVRYFAGDIGALESVAVSPGGTETQRRVWSALRTIPAGRTLTYGRLAAQVGMPNGARAVGGINGFNPVPIVVPCHRVIGADGSLTGFGGGLDRKRWLLEHEGALELRLLP